MFCGAVKHWDWMRWAPLQQQHQMILIFAEIKTKKDFSVSTSSATDCLVQIDLLCNCHLCSRAHLSILQHYVTGLKSSLSCMFVREISNVFCIKTELKQRSGAQVVYLQGDILSLCCILIICIMCCIFAMTLSINACQRSVKKSEWQRKKASFLD